MKILSIETSSNICGVSILENDKILYEKNSDNGLSHSENLMSMVDIAFKECNLKVSDIDLFAASKGPGSFTGIRIGISTIMAFNDVLSKDAYGISSLEGLAYNENSSEYVCSIINARNNNAYAGLFKKENDYYILIDNYLSDSIDNIVISLEKYKDLSITFVGDGSVEFKELLQNNFSKCTFSTNNNCNSTSIGIAALKHYKNKLDFDNSLTPMYLKKSQAERQLEEGKLK